MFAELIRQHLPKSKQVAKAKPRQEARLMVEALEDRTLMSHGLGAETATNLRRSRQQPVPAVQRAARNEESGPGLVRESRTAARGATERQTAQRQNQAADRQTTAAPRERAATERQSRAARETTPSPASNQRQARQTTAEPRTSRQQGAAAAPRTTTYQDNARRSNAQATDALFSNFDPADWLGYGQYAPPWGELPPADHSGPDSNWISLYWGMENQLGRGLGYDTNGGLSVLNYDQQGRLTFGHTFGQGVQFPIQVGPNTTSLGIGFGWTVPHTGHTMGAGVNFNAEVGYMDAWSAFQSWLNEPSGQVYGPSLPEGWSNSGTEYFGPAYGDPAGYVDPSGSGYYHDDNAAGKEHHYL